MRFGTLTLKDRRDAAIDYTESGFAVYPGLYNAVAGLAKRFREEWPSSAAVYLPENRVPKVGEVLRNPDWAAALKKAVDIEIRERKRGREGAIQAAIDYWYQDEPAERMVEYLQKTSIRDASRKSNHGLLTKEDFAEWKPKLEEPAT